MLVSANSGRVELQDSGIGRRNVYPYRLAADLPPILCIMCVYGVIKGSNVRRSCANFYNL